MPRVWNIPPAGVNCYGGTSRGACALIDDPNSRMDGALLEGGGSTPNTKVRIQNRPVALHGQHAEDDDHDHEDTNAISNSCGSVRIHNQLIHRVGDPRNCGATTVAFPNDSGRFFIA